MANTYALGGSPLGLINVKSRPERTGMSTFNGGKSRNMNVFSYNRGVPQPANIQVGGKEAYAPVSLMTGGSLPTFWPNADIGKIGSDSETLGVKAAGQKPERWNGAKGTGISSDYHNDAAYDTSLLNIIEKLSRSKSSALRPQDFAYCKYLGVYPNNRLMIARRFPSPSKDNIFGKSGQPPKSILISWKPESEDFLEFTFGEEWTDADADFTNVLNKLGKDFGIDSAGGGLSKAINLIPLPGFTEQIQKQILLSMGVITEKSLGEPLPSGNPNLIKMAKRRKTIAYGEAGAGLKCTISIKMDCEYEQKFISGIDPTSAWQDILNNIVIFGTSNSSYYGLDPKFEGKLNKWLTNPGILVTEVIEAVIKAVKKIVGEIKLAGEKALKSLNEAISPAKEVPDSEKQENNNKLVESAKKQLNSFFARIQEAAYKTISKYKIEIMGIAHALSGSPSTPWHITIGNPLRPFFCAGDMLCGDVTLTFGPVLAFNDLPSSIKVSFTLTNARPLGMQEILAKFNAGSLRTVNVKKDYLEAEIEGADDKATTVAEKAARDEKVKNSLLNPKLGYFDGVFDQFGAPMGGETNTQGSSPSSAGSNTGPLTGAGAFTTTNPNFNLNDNQNIIINPQTGTTVVTEIVPNPDGSNTFITQEKTLKDNGDVIASLEPEGSVVQGINPNSSVFSSGGTP
jgi:hypothetical protein